MNASHRRNYQYGSALQQSVKDKTKTVFNSRKGSCNYWDGFEKTAAMNFNLFSQYSLPVGCHCLLPLCVFWNHYDGAFAQFAFQGLLLSTVFILRSHASCITNLMIFFLFFFLCLKWEKQHTFSSYLVLEAYFLLRIAIESEFLRTF